MTGDPYPEPHVPGHPLTLVLLGAATLGQWAALGALVALAWTWLS